MTAKPPYRYQMIAEEIREQIRRGDLGPGDNIPSLPELAAEYGVSYNTAQNAVALLKASGDVEARQGQGTVVLETRPVIDSLDSGDVRDYSWPQVAAGCGAVGTTRIIHAGMAAAPADVTDAFGYEAETEIASRRRLILADGDAVQIVTSFYAPGVVALVPELMEPGVLRAWAPALMAEAGIEMEPPRDAFVSRGATAEEAETLGLVRGAHVLDVLRVVRAGGEVVMVEIMVSNSARIRHVSGPWS